MTDAMQAANEHFRFTMSEDQARNVHKVVDGQCQALKNWIVSAVESEDYERAHSLTEELRAFQALFAAFNVDAKVTIAQSTGKPITRIVQVEDRSRFR